MWKEQSHKSYRPVTVATFRFNIIVLLLTSSSLSFAIIVIIMFMVILKVELPGTRAGPPWLPPCQHCPSRASHSSLSSGDNHHHHHVHDEDGNDESPLMIKRMEHGTESVDSCSLSLHHPSSHQLLLA